MHLDFNCGLVNSLKPRLNKRHFADNRFKRIFLNENVDQYFTEFYFQKSNYQYFNTGSDKGLAPVL